MHLPFMQLAMEIIDQVAPDLAILLDVPEEKAGWGLVKMFKWGLGRVPDGELPSDHAIIPGPAAAKLIARAAGWTGDEEVFVDCCEQVRPKPVLERVEGGIRLCGLSRYDTAVDGAQARSEKARLAAQARWGAKPEQSSGHAPSNAQASSEHQSGIAQTMLGDAKTQTQTHMKKEALGDLPEKLLAGSGKASSGGAGGPLPLPEKRPRPRSLRASEPAGDLEPAPKRVRVVKPPPPSVYPPRTLDELPAKAAVPTPSPPLARPKHFPVPPPLAQEAWNLAVEGTPLRRWKAVTLGQAKQLMALNCTTADWTERCQRVARNRYLRGEKGKHPAIGITWLLNPKNFAKVLDEYADDMPEPEVSAPTATCARCEKSTPELWAVGDEGREYLLCQECLAAMVELELPSPAAVSDWIEALPRRKAARA